MPTVHAAVTAADDDLYPYAGIGGDAEAAFDALFRAHHAGMCSVVHQMVRSRPVAEELVQDVFVRIWDRPDRGTSSEVTRAYLYTAARNAALSHLRRERMHATWMARESIASHDAASACDELEYEELATAVQSAIERLPSRTRLVFTMHRQQELTYAEIAEVLGLSVKTVEAQMGRALRLLRASLGSFVAVALLLVVWRQ
jgi:RNA polymerase sigma-70 factor (ECF subfamily)